MRQVIRLNEQELHNLISESVKRVLNETTDEGLGRNLAMAGALGASIALGGQADAQNIEQYNQSKANSEIQHALYNKIHKSTGDTLSYNDWYNQIGQRDSIMRSNITPEGNKIYKFIESEMNPDAMTKIFRNKSKDELIREYGGPQNCMLIWGIILPKTMTLEQFKQKYNEGLKQYPQEFKLSDFDF